MKLQVPFLQFPLRFDADVLAAEVAAIGEDAWRPHPNGLPGNSALTLITTGGDPESDQVYGAMRPTPHLLRCPYLMQVLAAVGGTWGRTRLMRLSGQAEVATHVDINYYWRERVRVHVPIVTQPSVTFYCGDARMHMAAGECWIFDTWRPHRVVNDAARPRIHLVADTVGGDGFWKHLAAARPGGRDMPGWQARFVPPQPGAVPALDYESVNAPIVMTPWELREHATFLLGECAPGPAVAALSQVLLRLARRWHALWSAHGEATDGWPRYRALLDETMPELRAQSAGVHLRNGIPFLQAVSACITDVALRARREAATPAMHA
jgi:hypothetical protein